MSRSLTAAVIGAGPAGLMAAERLAEAGLAVTVYEAQPTPARKFLMAGKSGLNLTFEGDESKLLAGYGSTADLLGPILAAFDHAALRGWAEDLGQPTFTGSTGRVFPVAMKASPLLRAWLARLGARGVTLRTRTRWAGWDGAALAFVDGTRHAADVTVLACGGASWARLGSDGAWAGTLGGPLRPFAPSNVGLRVAWSPHMAPHFGHPVKSVTWSAGNLASRGEATLTASGLEGGGIYALSPALRDGASLVVDLVPHVPVTDLAERWQAKPGKQTVSAFLRKVLKLPPVKVALFNEFGRRGEVPVLLKALPIPLSGLAPMDGAISTAGGVPFARLTEGLMLRDRPGVFCAGEMLDWDAPTGGWLLTACFATGAWAGRHAAIWAREVRPGSGRGP